MASARKPTKAIASAPTGVASLKTARRSVQMMDIAQMAGVSASTVSRALSGSALIPESTRQRITGIARSLNYRVNVGAASLRKRDVHTIGVAILGDSMQSISDPFLLSILGTVADALDERGMSLMLTRLRESSQDSLTNMLDSGQVAGLIIIGQLTWHEHLNALAREGLPIAVWGACLPDAVYPVVGGDNAAGGYLATRHLIEQGCRRIAYFGDTSHPEAGMRYQGYLRAMQEAGITPDPRLVQPFLFGYVRIRETIDQWLDQQLTFDAIFATSDVTAISILGALTERGIAVPSQVKLVGYDDIAIAAHLHPSITSIRQPADQAGRALVDLLFDVLQGKGRRTVMLPATLIARDSSA
jgi:DNA-binding LacI/PurR family transcriptional regulator